MANWIQRVGAMFSGRGHAPPPGLLSRRPQAVPERLPAPVAVRHHPVVEAHAETAPHVALPWPQPRDAVPAPAAEEGDPQGRFFEWLLDAGPTLDLPLLPREQRLLARLDTVLASDSSRNELLPRAPAVIPQLMKSLRDEGQSNLALAERVEKDPNLVAEVLRLANSATTRGGDRIGDIPQAIGRLGTEGLRRAIARVVLKPIFDAAPDSLSGRAAPRLWMHSEAKAAECMRLAARAGLDPFDGYLAGLMHNVGWTAALRVLDQAEAGAQAQFTSAFVAAFEPKREMFFALLVAPWGLTEPLTRLAQELSLGGGLAAAGAPLAAPLAAADRRACLDVLEIDIPLDVASPTPGAPPRAPVARTGGAI